MSIQPSDEDIQQFRKDTAERQVKELSGIFYKSDGETIVALSALEELYPNDDPLARTERIIKFLKILKRY